MGFQALNANTSNGNVAVGFQALLKNTTAGFPPEDGTNNAIGYQTLMSNENGIDNQAFGFRALETNTSGSFNNAFGWRALVASTGSLNTAIGDFAGGDLTSGDGNVYIGAGQSGAAVESNTTYIKNVFNSVATTRAVFVNGDNKIGTLASSRRYKEDIKPMDKASEAILALKPVTFRYKKQVDAARALSFGLIAEDVAEISPDLITRDEDGKPQTVRYEAVNAMLLNEFLKEHRTVQELKKEIAALTATVQKVSAQVEMSRTAPQTVVDNQ
jgi:hypothetical protein